MKKGGSIPSCYYTNLTEYQLKATIEGDLALNNKQTSQQTSFNNKNDLFLIKRYLDSILNYLKYFSQKIKNNQKDEEESFEWQFAALVIDRLCIYLFSLATILATSLILLTSPNIYRSSDPDPIF